MVAAALILICLLAAPATDPAIAHANDITIKRSDPTINRVTFNRNNPPADMPKLDPGEAALTRCDYECKAGVSYEVIKRTKIADHWHVWVHIAHVNVDTRLVDTIFLPQLAPTLLRAHEEGHREMNERVYREGESALRSAASEILSHDWEADGADSDAAGKVASDEAVQHVCDVYLEKTASRASRLGDIYDRLTDHGRNQLYVANAIRLSFLEEQRTPSTQQDDSIHPTRSSAN